MWYPVDRVKGDSVFEQGAGYSGKFPVYYAVSGRAYTAYEYRHAFYRAVGDYDTCGRIDCPPGYRIHQTYCYETSGTDYVQCVCTPNGINAVKLDGSATNYDMRNPFSCEGKGVGKAATANVQSAFDGWYRYDGHSATINPVKNVFPPVTKNPELVCGSVGCRFTQEYTRSDMDFDSIVQVVTPTAQNKYWASRVYPSSQYKIANGTIEYKTANTPFGSMQNVYPSNNPYEWPKLRYSKDLGQIFGCVGTCTNVTYPTLENFPYAYQNIPEYNQDTNELKYIFAKSYGYWKYNAKHCEGGPNKDLSCEENSDCATTCGVKDGAGAIKGYCDIAKSGNITSTNITCSNNNECENYATNVNGSLFSTCDSATKKCVGGCNEGKDCAAAIISYDDDVCRQVYCDAATKKCVRGLDSGKDCVANADCRIDVSVKCDRAAGKCVNGSFAGEDCRVDTDNTKCVDSAKNCSYSCQKYCEASADSSIKCANDADCAKGLCVANEGNNQGRYNPQKKNAGNAAFFWEPPEIKCPGLIRGERDYCGIPPVIYNILANGSDEFLSIVKNHYVNLTFNTLVDDDQQPLVFYVVDWGDGAKTSFSGAEMRDRPNSENPHSLYHLFDYWDLKAKDVIGSNRITCGIDGNGKNYCEVTPSIQVKDNWGWCNGAANIKDCTHWEAGPKIKVLEK
jgi:hypothetical protein